MGCDCRGSPHLRPQEARAALIFDGLCLIWLVAGVLMAAALLPWSDQSTVLFGYPGPLFPIACWMLAVAAIATPVALALALPVWRPTDWSWLRWARAAAAVALFATLSISLWDWGLLGYSGF